MPLVGTTELLVIGAAIAALIIGPKKLPELARSLGESKKEFKKSMDEAEKVEEELKMESDSEAEESA